MTELPYRLVAVEWLDSYGVGTTWEEMPKRPPPAHRCYSVGWLVSKTEDVVVIVPHVSPANPELGNTSHGCGDMTIPRCSVVKIVNLGAKA